jgi:hypothetical protein
MLPLFTSTPTVMIICDQLILSKVRPKTKQKRPSSPDPIQRYGNDDGTSKTFSSSLSILRLEIDCPGLPATSRRIGWPVGTACPRE